MKFNFDNINLRNLLKFSDILNDTFSYNLDIIKSKYNKMGLHFDDILYFFIDLNLCKIENNSLIPNLKFEEIYNNSSNYNLELNNLILSKMFSNNCRFRDTIQKYISSFEFKDSNITFRPLATFNIKYSGLRNLLIELDFLNFDDKNSIYIIENNNIIYLEQLFKKKSISAKHLKHILSKKNEIGLKAEIEILSYEKNLLKNHPELALNIEHTSQPNASAGYDIKSFSVIDTGEIIEKYIEVKAVSISDYRFYISKNELEKSKILSNKYYIYLLPVLSKDKFDVNNLLIIQNPYNTIFNDNINWHKQIENYSFEKL